ncbi:MAG: glutaminyl-peptide cyclotransferase [Pyrinomonadaceae bacterium]
MRTLLMIAACFVASCGGSQPGNNSGSNVGNTNTRASVPIYSYDIVKTYPHDPTAFTQGLDFYQGVLYEGTGGRGTDSFRSSLRKVEIETGKVLQKHDVAPEYFGEGITVLNDKIYQLTWRERTAFVYSLADIKPLKEFRYTGEGWGLTNDGTSLYMSDGTHVIRVLDPETFDTKRTIVVNDERGSPIMQLNELEWVKGEIWANVWQSAAIVRIDPANGKYLGRIDLDAVTKEEQSQNEKADVLNGIAYDEATDRLFVTGKLWRRLFEIKVKPKQ